MSDTPRTDAIAPVGYARAQDLLLYSEVWAGYSNKPADENGHPPVALYTQDQVDMLLAALRAQLAEARKENDTLRGLLGNSAKPCPYCGLAAEDQAKCQHGFPGCSRADDQMLSKHFADAYRAEQAEAQLAEALEENARLKERVALDDTEREYRRQSLANEIRETLKVRGHFAAERPSDLIGCVARAIESERDRANLAEAELAALREQLAERDAEIAALKGHAEAMCRILQMGDGGFDRPETAAYRAAYPKE